MSVDVIIPVHDGAAFVERAVRSALREGTDDTTIICVDDASTDSSPHILDALAKPPPSAVVWCGTRKARANH